VRLTNKKALEKFKRKYKGSKFLTHAIDKLVHDIETNYWKSRSELQASRSDEDCVHNDGFYFFNISAYRTMVLIELNEQEATVVWCGNHKAYEQTFRNNKETIKKWLSSHNWI
jgi:mRNA interferase HigB